MHVIIKGRPIPYKRTTQKQKWVDKSYHKYRDYKQLVQIMTNSQFKGHFKDKPLIVEVTVHLYGKGSLNMGRDGDIDNYIKAALDSLNKVVYDDDRQVVSVRGTKCICYKKEDERMEIDICETGI